MVWKTEFIKLSATGLAEYFAWSLKLFSNSTLIWRFDKLDAHFSRSNACHCDTNRNFIICDDHHLVIIKKCVRYLNLFSSVNHFFNYNSASPSSVQSHLLVVSSTCPSLYGDSALSDGFMTWRRVRPYLISSSPLLVRLHGCGRQFASNVVYIPTYIFVTTSRTIRVVKPF